MTALRTALLASFALGCFAANSLLCRAALGARLVDPATFTAVRLASGALALALLAAAVHGARRRGGGLGSALALFGYAASFSLAYDRVQAGPGALLLFSAVQLTMLGSDAARGARPGPVSLSGVALALAGVAHLSLGGTRDVDAYGAVLMLVAGACWGIYSLRGLGEPRPLAATAANFAWSVPLAAALALATGSHAHASPRGLALAVASGALASAGGYVAWYAAVPRLGASRAAAVQLAVPVLTALAAVPALGERFSGRLATAAALTLGGVALAVRHVGEGQTTLRTSVSWPARVAPR
jgi:drug/metabolite transporter (DMT)-like permease